MQRHQAYPPFPTEPFVPSPLAKGGLFPPSLVGKGVRGLGNSRLRNLVIPSASAERSRRRG